MAQVTEFRGPSDGIREDPHDNQHIIQRSNAAGHDIFLVIIVQKRPSVLQTYPDTLLNIILCIAC